MTPAGMTYGGDNNDAGVRWSAFVSALLRSFAAATVTQRAVALLQFREDGRQGWQKLRVFRRKACSEGIVTGEQQVRSEYLFASVDAVRHISCRGHFAILCAAIRYVELGKVKTRGFETAVAN
jgi:hypothetical protein